MIDAKSISEEQKAQIQTWADEGAGLPGIQKRLDSEFKIKATYMDTRFLIDDLGIAMPEDEKPEEAEEAEEESEAAVPETPTDADSSEEPVPSGDLLDEPGSEGPGSVTVTISELQRPGMMVNGSVTFAGGEVAEWYLDQFGRLGLDPRNPEFRPSEPEMMAFQKELQKVAQKKGL